MTEEFVLVRHGDARSLLAAAGEYLVAREAEHNLILGTCARLEAHPAPFGEEPCLVSVARAGETVAVAVRTPPHNLVLSEVEDPAAVELLARTPDVLGDSLPGVMGSAGPSRRFAEAWAAATGARMEAGLCQRIYRTASVVSPSGVSGGMRRAAEGDRALLVEWTEAFAAEALPGAPTGDAGEMVRERLAGVAGAGLFLWENGGLPVSLAGCAGQTPNGIRVGPVYTPPELRGHGYASALTAALTRALLEGGRRFCFLFTDLANPTSNRVYERIGYRPVADVDAWRFPD